MAENYKNIKLPINSVIPDITKSLLKKNTLIVSAPPGTGKSTLLPLAFVNQEWLSGKKILMLEPRRLAAKTIANRMASLLDEKVGQTIGYRIRFDNKISNQTKIEVLTEGILTRMLQHDNSLKDVGLVIFDEFHERSIFADVALALCRESQQVLRQDLRILVMSATLDIAPLSKILQAPIIESKGKQYPVDIIYTGMQDEQMLPELTAQTIIKAARETEGDILAFLPGEWEIKKCESLIRTALKDFSIHPLFGMLSPGKQHAAIMPDRGGKRKVVLATSIAETSLTIEGVKVIVDSGFGRVSRYDPKSGLSRLETIQISQDSATQRAGRAGRLAPGTCYRMWSKATQHQLTEHRTPEILETDLASLVLDLAQWGTYDASQLLWLTPPPRGMLMEASQTLQQLDAIENGKITNHGHKIHRLPCHPRIAHMLVMAEEQNMLPLACDLAAILEERDPLPRETGIDINLRIDALRNQRANERLQKKMSRIEKVASSYRKLLKTEPDNSSVDPYETGILLVYAYPGRIACSRPGNNAQFQLSNGSLAMAGHKDDLANEQWLAVAQINARDGMGKIFLASPLNPTNLAPMVKKKEVVEWDTQKGGLSARQELRIGSIILQSKPMKEAPLERLTEAISEAIKKEGDVLLDFNKEVKQWQNRVNSLRKWQPNMGFPDVSTPSLLATNSNWLEPYLNTIKKPEDLKKLNLLDILHHSLSQNQQLALAKLAPILIEVPSGSKMKLEYTHNGSAPVLAVRIQEVFGLADTPKVNTEKIPVLMHLLSPGYKPVQITSDLRNFWDNTYYEVRKELKGRYPKHAWPDDPWSAKAIRGTKYKPLG